MSNVLIATGFSLQETSWEGKKGFGAENWRRFLIALAQLLLPAAAASWFFWVSMRREREFWARLNVCIYGHTFSHAMFPAMCCRCRLPGETLHSLTHH